MLRNDQLETALAEYVKLLSDESMIAQKQRKTQFQLWMELCEFIAKYPRRAQ